MSEWMDDPAQLAVDFPFGNLVYMMSALLDSSFCTTGSQDRVEGDDDS